ncbi:MAG: hypothetical protein ACRDHL_05945 [Candidatus Promineifilaceae bacterium]
MSLEMAGGSREAKRERRRSRIRLTEAQAVLSWAVLLALLSVLGAIYLYQTSQIASVGRYVQQLQFELEAIKRANADLELAIAEAESLERLQREATRLGFLPAEPGQVEYLIVPNYPKEPAAPAGEELGVPAEPVETFGEALGLAFRASVSDLMRGEAP